MSDLYFPITNCKNIEKLMLAWEKTLKVINSCKTIEHKKHACTYIDLFIARFNLYPWQKDIYAHFLKSFPNNNPFIFE